MSENSNLQLKQQGGHTPAFVTKAMESLEAMEQYVNLLGKSGLLPKHFYEEHKVDNKNVVRLDASGFPIVKTGAVILCIQHGQEIGMSVTQALQQLIPVNGLVTMKGDGAKARILASGVCDIWEENSTGSIQDNNFQVTIFSKRTNGMEKTVTFSVDQAIRMGLWITQAMVIQKDYLKHSAWWKIPDRMIMYRALGFISRDLYPDVLAGTYLKEEIEEEDTFTFKSDAGLSLTPAKIDAVAAGNEKVTADLRNKESRRSSKASSPTKDISDSTKILPPISNVVKEQENLDFGKNEKGSEFEDYKRRVQAMSPVQLVQEFKNVIPFSIEKWSEAGGTKKPADIMLFTIGLKEDKVKEVCEKIGVNYNVLYTTEGPAESPKAEPEQKVSEKITEAYLQSKGLDPEMVATHLGYETLADMYDKCMVSDVEELL